MKGIGKREKQKSIRQRAVTRLRLRLEDKDGMRNRRIPTTTNVNASTVSQLNKLVKDGNQEAIETVLNAKSPALQVVLFYEEETIPVKRVL